MSFFLPTYTVSDKETPVIPNTHQILCFPLLQPFHYFPSLLSLPITLPVSPSRRSCSIDKSPGSSNAASPISHRKDINRSESLRVVSNQTHRIFRPSDLIHGEVLGKGCFGQAIKVDLGAETLLAVCKVHLQHALMLKRTNVVILTLSRRWQHWDK